MKQRFAYISYCFILSLLFAADSFSQYKPSAFGFGEEEGGGSILSNVIVDIVGDGQRIWFGTNKGIMMTPDNGLSFRYFGAANGIGKGSVSALTISNNVIWVATAFDTLTKEGELTAGGGLAYSDNNGEIWHYISQPVDPRDVTTYKPTTTHVQNVTYDIAVNNDTIWIASWGGGVRKSINKGKTWVVNPPDDLPFDALQYLNHRGFAVIHARNGLWVGTAGGIDKSMDGGRTWTRYTAQNGSGISGNFVTALAEQRVGSRSIIWAATWKAEGQDEDFGVSKTENNGLTWKIILKGIKAHNFGFHDSDVYVATDIGLFKSDDYGITWAQFLPASDHKGNQLLTTVYNGVNFINGALWGATNDGLVRTSDNGNRWDIFRAFQPTSGSSGISAYAYPNPFSPSRHNVLGEDGHVRIQYSTKGDTQVTLTIYDFAMKRVAEAAKEKDRTGSGEFAETWNGRNERGEQVANGVYFYKLDLQGQGTYWGKIVVID